MSLQEMIEMYKREKAEKKQARLRKKINKRKSIDPYTMEEIRNHEDLLALLRESVINRSKDFLDRGTVVNNWIHAENLNNIVGVMLEDWDKYKGSIIEYVDTAQADIRYVACVICIKTGTNTKKAIEKIREISKRKSEYGVIGHEAREFVKRYNTKRIPAYEGFKVDYKYIAR